MNKQIEDRKKQQKEKYESEMQVALMFASNIRLVFPSLRTTRVIPT